MSSGSHLFKKFIYFVRLLLLFLLFSTALYHAQDKDNLSLLQKIDSLALRTIIEGKAAGLSLTVLKGGKTLLSKGYGYADLENHIPANPKTIYPIASITKQFTAVSILQLVEKGKISLEDSLAKYFPGYPAPGNKITIHQLLNHTSGIKNITSLGAKYWSQIGRSVTPEDLVNLFRSEPFDFNPGEDYSYNNSDYILLGLIIEKVTGLPYGDYLKKYIFKLFGFNNTYYYPDLKDTAKLAKLYSHNDGSFKPAVFVNPTQGYSMGGICSTAEDLSRWLLLLHSGEIIGSSVYKKMITPGFTKTGERISYGYGVGVGEFSGHKLLFHAGGIFGSDAQSIYFPDERLVIVILANTDDADAVKLENQISTLLLGVADVPEIKLSNNEKIKYTGNYKFRTAEVKVYINNDSLYITGLWGSDPVKLKFISEDTFSAEGQFEHLKFIMKENNAVRLRLVHYGARIAEFIKAD